MANRNLIIISVVSVFLTLSIGMNAYLSGEISITNRKFDQGEEEIADLEYQIEEIEKLSNGIEENQVTNYLNKSRIGIQNIKFESITKTISSPQNLCELKITYPQIPRPTNSSENYLNKELSKFFSDDRTISDICDEETIASGNENKFKKEITYSVGTANENLISIMSESISYYVNKNSNEIAQPYPNTKYSAFNYDQIQKKILTTEEMFSISDLNNLKIDVVKKIKSNKDFAEIDLTGDVSKLSNREYFWYINNGKLVVFNIFEPHAVRSVKVELSY